MPNRLDPSDYFGKTPASWWSVRVCILVICLLSVCLWENPQIFIKFYNASDPGSRIPSRSTTKISRNDVWIFRDKKGTTMGQFLLVKKQKCFVRFLFPDLWGQKVRRGQHKDRSRWSLAPSRSFGWLEHGTVLSSLHVCSPYSDWLQLYFVGVLNRRLFRSTQKHKQK